MTKSELPLTSTEEIAQRLGDSLEGGPALGLDLLYYIQDLYRRVVELEQEVQRLKASRKEPQP